MVPGAASMRPFFRILRIEIPDVIDMGEFRGDATEIFPDAHRMVSISCWRFFRKCRRQVGAADLVLREPWPDPARDGCKTRPRCAADRSRRVMRSTPTAMPPTTAPVTGFAASRRPALVRREDASSECDDDLAEDLPAFHALEGRCNIADWHFGVDNRLQCPPRSCRGFRQYCAWLRRTNRRCGTAAGTAASG